MVVGNSGLSEVGTTNNAGMKIATGARPREEQKEMGCIYFSY